MEYDLWWKMTFDGRQPLMEDNLRWETTFQGEVKKVKFSMWTAAAFTRFCANLFVVWDVLLFHINLLCCHFAPMLPSVFWHRGTQVSPSLPPPLVAHTPNSFRSNPTEPSVPYDGLEESEKRKISTICNGFVMVPFLRLYRNSGMMRESATHISSFIMSWKKTFTQRQAYKRGDNSKVCCILHITPN